LWASVGVQLDDLTVENRIVGVHFEGGLGCEVGKTTERVTVARDEPVTINVSTETANAIVEAFEGRERYAR
jgi:hypothetical protein